MENNLKDLITQAKSNKPKTVIQKTVPIIEKKLIEKQFSFFLDANLLKQIKLMALNSNKSIKDVIIEALEKHLKSI